VEAVARHLPGGKVELLDAGLNVNSQRGAHDDRRVKGRANKSVDMGEFVPLPRLLNPHARPK